MTSKIRLSQSQTERLNNILDKAGVDKNAFMNAMFKIVEDNPVIMDMIEARIANEEAIDTMVKKVLLLDISDIETKPDTNLVTYDGKSSKFTDSVVEAVRKALMRNEMVAEENMNAAKDALNHYGITVELLDVPVGRFHNTAFAVHTQHGYICIA